MSVGRNPKFWSVFMLLAMTATMTFPSFATAQDIPTGDWTAVLESPMGNVTVSLVLKHDDDVWSGTVSDSQEQQEKELQDIRIGGNRVQFKVHVPEMNTNGEFSGTFDAEANTLIGSFGVPGIPQKQELTFRRTVIEEGSSRRYKAGSGPAGAWIGKVRSPDGEDTEVTLTLDKGDDNEWVATLEDPFVNTVRGEDVKVTSSLISFTFRPQNAPFPSHFTGTYIAADDRVSGSFSQRGTSRFVKFRRDPATVVLPVDIDGKTILPARDRHGYHLALTGRMSFWAALHVVKDETYTLNSLTTGNLNYDGALKWYAMDAFALFGRYFKGGFNFSSDADMMEPFLPFGIPSESYLKLDGYEFGFIGYLGNIITPNNNFNPYLTGAMGFSSWELTTGDRGSEVAVIDRELVVGDDLCFAAGLGTEYMFSDHIALELELLWRFFMTEDAEVWEDTDNVWSNTHAWSLSAGLTFGFF